MQIMESGNNEQCTCCDLQLPMCRYCSVVGELSYIKLKRKVHENFHVPVAGQAKEIDGYVPCTFPYLSML